MTITWLPFDSQWDTVFPRIKMGRNILKWDVGFALRVGCYSYYRMLEDKFRETIDYVEIATTNFFHIL